MMAKNSLAPKKKNSSPELVARKSANVPRRKRPLLNWMVKLCDPKMNQSNVVVDSAVVAVEAEKAVDSVDAAMVIEEDADADVEEIVDVEETVIVVVIEVLPIVAAADEVDALQTSPIRVRSQAWVLESLIYPPFLRKRDQYNTKGKLSGGEIEQE